MEADELDKRAAFATKFQGTTNLDQRRRFAQDISEAKAREEERARADFEQLQLDRPEVGRLMLGREKAEQAARNQLQVRDLAERKFQWDMEKASRLESLNTKRAELEIRREDRLLKQAELKMERANLEEEDTLAVEMEEQALRDAGIAPGSTEYQKRLVGTFLRYPYVNKEYRNMALKSAGLTDPEVQFQQAADAVQAGAARATAKLPGGGTATFEQPEQATSKAPKIDNARLDRIKKLRAEIIAKPAKSRTEGDNDLLGYYDNEISAIDAQRRAVAKGTTPATPAAPSAPVDGMASNLTVAPAVQATTRPPLAEIFK